MSKRNKPARVDPDFLNGYFPEVKKRWLENFKEDLSVREFTKRLPKAPSAKQIVDELIQQEKWNKLGSGYDLIIWMIIGFFSVVFFMAFMWGFGMVTDIMTQLPATNESGINMSQAASQTFGVVNDSLISLRWIAFVLIVAQLISILISNAFVRDHPVMFFVYLGYTIVAVIVAAYISNSYHDLIITQQVFGSTGLGFTGVNWIFDHLHIVVTVVGLLGSVFLFINMMVGRESGGVY